MALTSSNYAADAYVTAANPAPGREEYVSYLVPSGTGFQERFLTKSDGGIGLNVYIAGGTGPGGAIPVTGTLDVNLSGATISGSFGGDVNITASIPLYVTSTVSDPVWVTGSVEVVNLAFPATQSVEIVSPDPLRVTGSVEVVGTASVAIVSLPSPIDVTGTVRLESTGVFVQNWPETQNVLVTNDLTASLSGVTIDSGALLVTGSFVLAGFSATVAASEVHPSSSNHNSFPFSTSSVVLLQANPTRSSFSIYNDSCQAYLVRLGPSASIDLWTFSLLPDHYYESPYPGYTGIVTGIGYMSGAGNIRVEEMI